MNEEKGETIVHKQYTERKNEHHEPQLILWRTRAL